MTANHLTARGMLPIYLRDTLEKLAIRHCQDETKLQQIQDLLSQLAPDEIDDKVLQTVLVSTCENFGLLPTDDASGSGRAKLDAMVERLRAANAAQRPSN